MRRNAPRPSRPHPHGPPEEPDARCVAVYHAVPLCILAVPLCIFRAHRPKVSPEQAKCSPCRCAGPAVQPRWPVLCAWRAPASCFLMVVMSRRKESEKAVQMGDRTEGESFLLTAGEVTALLERADLEGSRVRMMLGEDR